MDMNTLEKPFGLLNLGNTCYMNVILQTLLNLKDFNKQILHSLKDVDENTMTRSYLVVFISIIKLIRNQQKIKKLKLTSFFLKFRNKFREVSFNQQDTNEALHFLFHEMHKDLRINLNDKQLNEVITNMISNVPKKMKKGAREDLKMLMKTRDFETNEVLSDYSSLNEFFFGVWKKNVICNSCNFNVNRFEFFKGFQVEIKYDNLDEILKNYFASEYMEDYKCNKCNEEKCDSKFHLVQTPKYLIITLKRFLYMQNTNRFRKINDKVSYPLELDLKDYAIGDIDCQYKMNSIINHYGDVNGGHYTSYHYFNDKWVWADDEDVRLVDENRVINNNFAYVLIYEKV
jgi:ubiquitin C-terminal hydrolase